MAFAAGSVVINNSAVAVHGTPAIIGQILEAGSSGAGYWDVLWESGDVALDIAEAGLYDFLAPATPSLRPAVRKVATGIAPAPDACGMVVAQNATLFVIRSPAGYQYVVTAAEITYLDRQ